MKKGKITACVLLVVLNLAFIWGNSMLTGQISGDISGGLMDWLRSVFGDLITWGEVLLRKLGHFTEFACLGGLLAWLCRLLEQRGIHRYSMPLLGGMIAACVDETIQVFTPDRGPSVIDVWIDTGGVCTGIILGTIGYILCTKFNLEENKL